MSVSEGQNTSLYENNSTNDHAILLPIPSVVRIPFRIASAISPKLGGDLGRRIFFRPPPPRYTPVQREHLARAKKYELSVMGKKAEAFGWGSGPTVLLIHGWGGHSGQMTEFVAPLESAGMRAIAADMPAHGRSSGRLSSLVHYSEAIKETARRFGPIHGVIAHSLGNAGLVRAFLDGLTANRAVLISPQAQFEDYWRLFRMSIGMQDRAWAEMVSISERWLDIRFADIHPAVNAPKMITPALIVHGLRDRVSPVSEGRRLAELWPDARMTELDSGHLSILKDARAVREATEFVRG